jgi:hypothetical protein
MKPQLRQPKAPKTGPEATSRHFRIVKLEPRIAPSFSPRGTANLVGTLT